MSVFYKRVIPTIKSLVILYTDPWFGNVGDIIYKTPRVGDQFDYNFAGQQSDWKTHRTQNICIRIPTVCACESGSILRHRLLARVTKQQRHRTPRKKRLLPSPVLKNLRRRRRRRWRRRQRSIRGWLSLSTNPRATHLSRIINMTVHPLKEDGRRRVSVVLRACVSSRSQHNQRERRTLHTTTSISPMTGDDVPLLGLKILCCDIQIQFYRVSSPIVYIMSNRVYNMQNVK